MLSTNEVENQLVQWETDIRQAVANVTELENLSTYQIICQRPVPAENLTGVSRAKVEPLVADMKQMWPHLSLVISTVQEARKLKNSSRRLSDRDLNEIDRLLNGQSIKLPDTIVPLQKRGLVSAASQANYISPRALLNSLVGVFTAVRDVMFTIDEIWTVSQPAFDQQEKELNAVRTLAQTLAAVEENKQLARLDQLLAEARRISLSDPLAYAEQADNPLAGELAALQGRLQALQEARKDLAATVTRAQEKLRQIEAEDAELSNLKLEVEDAISNGPALARSDMTLARLQEWQGRIVAETEPDKVLAHLNQWFAKAEQFQGETRSLTELAKSVLEERQMLKSRVKAYKNTAGRSTYKGVVMLEEAEFSRLCLCADQALARPTDMKAACKAVNDVHGRLRSLEQWEAEDKGSNQTSKSESV